MRQIVYMSRAKIHLPQEALAELRLGAYERNEEMGVTGLLVYDGSRYIQALEGKADSVHEIMNSIANDSRHDHITYLADRPLKTRQFVGWALEYIGFEGSEPFVDRVKKG